MTVNASLTMGADVYDWSLYGALDFAGYYHHQLRKSDTSQSNKPAAQTPEGTSIFTGTGLAFRHVQHRYDEVLDRFGIVHLPGLRVDGSVFFGPVDVRIRYGFFPDFSSIDSAAYSQFLTETGRRASRTVLEEEGYYHGWGVTSELILEVNVARLRLHWQWNLHRVWSIDARDRFRDDEERFGPDLDDYLRLTDGLDHHAIGAAIDIPGTVLEVGAVGEYRGRRGTVDADGQQWHTELRDVRGLGVLQVVF